MIGIMLERLEENHLKGVVDLIMLKLLTVVSKAQDPEVRSLINNNLEKIIDKLSSEKLGDYIKRITKWLNNGTNEQDRNFQKLALNVRQILDNFSFYQC